MGEGACMAIVKTFMQNISGCARQRWHMFSDFDSIIDDVITRIGKSASEAIAERGVFSIVLAGGDTPQALYRELDRIATDWRSWLVYFGDERCLPVGAEERNDTMAFRSWLDHVPIPRQQIFSIPAELGADMGAKLYANILAHIPAFDLVLLGLGDDGHTASLFAGVETPLKSDTPALGVHAAPKLPRERISMSAARLSDAHDVWFLVCGESKRKALQQLREGVSISAAAIKPAGGVDIFTDIVLS
jgi:6-phosphogluconolactonase